MSQVYRRLNQQQEENRRSFEAINTRMDKMDDQLSFLCYSNQMTNEQMLSPYQNTARQFKEMEMQGIPVTMANLAIHRQREEEINQERMRYNQILQEVAEQQAREANKASQHQQQQPQFQHQQEFPSGFYTHFDTSMSQVYRRLDQQQEENRRSFEVINTRMDRMDDQLSFLCYSNKMTIEQMLSPYQNTARQFKEMEMQGIPVTMANLAIHRQREEEKNQERMRYNQIVQEVAAQQAREANKGKTREVVPDSEDEFVSSESEEF
ncbi:hypothetical protein PIB30_083632 [Stylosanthes scabra]|uniref:Uncharacterized protein n=1 Tax=Stylosanthes scabra TaxID=79078 RepID=A0ABU6STD2_9FABA|nr:hypothetical protein [Stylosanthes scabra]